MAAPPNKKETEMKEEIAMYLKKKDYYDILGITKNSQEAEIKKAYKKLALRFHPDKNHTQGAKQVFNKISNAYTNLVDPEKRATYDRYGPEEDREPKFRPQRQYRQGYTQEDQFQEIFRAFFGGGMGMRGNRFQNNHYQHFTFNMGGSRTNNNQQNGSSLMYFFIFIMVLYILPAFLTKQQPLYSTTHSSTYRFPMKTTNFQVPYFVREEFHTQNKNGQLLKGIEEAVDTEFLMKLKKQCDMLTLSRSYGASASAHRERYRESCRRLQYLQQKFPNYIRDLIYGY